MRLIQDLGRWVEATARWLGEAWRVWARILGVALVFSAALLLPLCLADVLRYCGLLFQLIGIATVVWGLYAKGRSFGRSLVFENIRRWWDRRPRWRTKHQAILLTGIASMSSVGSARISGWCCTPLDVSIEDRLAVLEGNLATMRTEQAETAKEFQEAMRKTNEAVDAEGQARASSATALGAQLKELAVGGLHIEWLGVFCFVIGAILATVPGELAAVLTWLVRAFPALIAVAILPIAG